MGVKWTNGSVKRLAIFDNNDYEQMIKDNFQRILTEIKNLVNTWVLQKLTIKGEILIVNTLLITQLMYAGTVIQLPEWIFDEYNDIITNFIWNKDPAKVKYSSMINMIDEGGL